MGVLVDMLRAMSGCLVLAGMNVVELVRVLADARVGYYMTGRSGPGTTEVVQRMRDAYGSGEGADFRVLFHGDPMAFLPLWCVLVLVSIIAYMSWQWQTCVLVVLLTLMRLE